MEDKAVAVFSRTGEPLGVWRCCADVANEFGIRQQDITKGIKSGDLISKRIFADYALPTVGVKPICDIMRTKVFHLDLDMREAELLMRIIDMGEDHCHFKGQIFVESIKSQYNKRVEEIERKLKAKEQRRGTATD